ncbi:MAG: glycoside hydrolase domain-containing protein, partial [Acidimicrobiales bacterium]
AVKQGISWTGAYIGGRGWTPTVWSSDQIDVCATAGLGVLPIWVGPQSGLSADIGTSHGRQCLAALAGLRMDLAGYSVALDVEASAFNENSAGAVAYANAWGDVLAAHRMRPVIYHPGWVTGFRYPGWLASWVDQAPNALPGSEAAWQWSSEGDIGGLTVDLSVAGNMVVVFPPAHFAPTPTIPAAPAVAAPAPGLLVEHQVASVDGNLLADVKELGAVATDSPSATAAATKARIGSLRAAMAPLMIELGAIEASL